MAYLRSAVLVEVVPESMVHALGEMVHALDDAVSEYFHGGDFIAARFQLW